jgi:hypothetical protein
MLKNGSRKRTDINLPTVEGEIKKLLAFPDSITILPHGVSPWDTDAKKWLNEQDIIRIDVSWCI